MKAIALAVLGLVLIPMLLMGPMLGLLIDPWAPYWFAGSTLAAPGVVPPDPVILPHGPLPADTTPLMAVISRYLGIPYIFGGNDPRYGLDCSSFVQLVMRDLGVSLPRTAQAQYDATARVSDPLPGDLVFFTRTYDSPDRVTHVGFYVGSGQMISEAVPAVGRQSLSAPFWRAHFFGYGRIRR